MKGEKNTQRIIYHLEYIKAETAGDLDKWILRIESAKGHLIKDISEIEHDLLKKLEQERNELKIKEKIAYSAKETAENAYQKCCKERNELKEAIKKLIIDYENQLDSILEFHSCDLIRDIDNVRNRTECEMLKLVTSNLKTLAP